MTKTVGLVVLVGSLGALAQTGPRVAPYPMQFPRPLSAPEAEALDSEFRDFLRAAGAKVPPGAELKRAFAELKRQDCEVDDTCLAAFALFADALYGLYVSVDVGLKQTVVTGRIVDSAGKEFSRVQALSAPTGGKNRVEVAKALLQQLVVGLRVSELPVARPTVQAPAAPVDAGVVAPPAPVDAGVVFTPPPPPPVETGPSVGTIAGYSMVGVGGAAAIGGLVAYVTGRNAAGAEATPDGVLTPTGDRDRLRAAGTQQSIGVTLLGVGAAVAVGGLVWLVLTPAETPAKPVSLWISPMPGGAAVGVNGALP